MENKWNEVQGILKDLDKMHCRSGPLYQNLQLRNALMFMDKDEIRAICHLVESHSPSLRIRAVYRQEKEAASKPLLTINKENVNFDCTNKPIEESVEKMLVQVQEMPKEWVLIQLTPQFNLQESLNCNAEKFFTNPIHVSVFGCGRSNSEEQPFCITTNWPRDKVTNDVIEIMTEMHNILKDNKECLTNANVKILKSQTKKEAYFERRMLLNNRLKDLVRQVQDYWLAEWKCLFIGRLVDVKLEAAVDECLEKMLKDLNICDIAAKAKLLLRCLIKGYHHLNFIDLKKLLAYCVPNKTNRLGILRGIEEIIKKLPLINAKRHPVILMIDEKLDIIPWEMINVLQDHPVSRMPSFHFTYALFKEHEASIVEGLKIGVDSKKGKYIINPSLDLGQMEKRLSKFFKYWTPEWTGLQGVKPSSRDFKEILTESDIVSYSGHGSGTQYFSGEKIQCLRVKAVVLLFGCGSVALTTFGPQVEKTGSHYMYLIACSPCVLGMLWEVTDADTDAVTTEFLSQCVSSKAKLHWKQVDKRKWSKGNEITASADADHNNMMDADKHEPEVLRALMRAKHAATYYLTQASCVARGLPVRIN